MSGTGHGGVAGNRTADDGGAMRPSEPPLVAVYADESCLGNGKQGDNPGGAGVLIEFLRADGTLVRRDIWISEPATTNNRMALQSAIEAFRALSRKGRRFRVVFTSDSRYLVDGMTSWVHGWARRGWKRSGGAIENLELWLEAIRWAGEHEVDWRWVRGHDGHPQNEYVNHLATRAAAERSRTEGIVPSGFEQWMDAQGARKKGVVRGTPQAFPASGSFRAAPPLPSPASAGR